MIAEILIFTPLFANIYAFIMYVFYPESTMAKVITQQCEEIKSDGSNTKRYICGIIE
jgi:hypothetical protein